MMFALVALGVVTCAVALRLLIRARQMRALDRVSDRWLDEHVAGRH